MLEISENVIAQDGLCLKDKDWRYSSSNSLYFNTSNYVIINGGGEGGGADLI